MKIKIPHYFFILGISLLAGCAINHPVAKDYDKHFLNYIPEATLPRTKLKSNYIIKEETKYHRYQFRAVSVGWIHVWIVEFGKILDKTLKSSYVQSAFGGLEKNQNEVLSKGNIIEFSLESFEFKNHRAYVSLNIKLLQDGEEVFNKTYTSEGSIQNKTMSNSGPYRMTKATLQSTINVIDEILRKFITDINLNYQEVIPALDAVKNEP